MNFAFIFETALIILVAFLIGAILGYFIRSWFFRPKKAAIVAPAVEAPPPVAPKPEPVAKAAVTTPAPSNAPEPEVEADGKPSALSEPRSGQKDNLKQIKGIGPKIENTLNELGIYHFDQIAEWSPESIEWINGSLSFKGRVQREKWIEQAKSLAGAQET